jgi:xylulokinase
MGVMPSAGGSFRWFRDALGESEIAQANAGGVDVYDLLTAQAARAPAGCEGLLFLPSLSGERTPHPDPDARGVYFGLTLRHQKPHLVRAVMEGVAYRLRDSLELLRAMGLTFTQVRASGGGARSDLWRRILADIFETVIAIVNVTEGAAFGAALLAGVGAGVYRDVPEACARTIRVQESTAPGDARHICADYFPIYRALYRALAPHFKRVSAVSARYP